MRIENSVFLITGAGSGLGLASARELVGQGANVVLVDVNEAAGAALADELGKRAIFVRADITSESDCRTAIASAVGVFGALHGTVSQCWELLLMLPWQPAACNRSIPRAV